MASVGSSTLMAQARGMMRVVDRSSRGRNTAIIGRGPGSGPSGSRPRMGNDGVPISWKLMYAGYVQLLEVTASLRYGRWTSDEDTGVDTGEGGTTNGGDPGPTGVGPAPIALPSPGAGGTPGQGPTSSPTGGPGTGGLGDPGAGGEPSDDPLLGPCSSISDITREDGNDDFCEAHCDPVQAGWAEVCETCCSMVTGPPVDEDPGPGGDTGGDTGGWWR